MKHASVLRGSSAAILSTFAAICWSGAADAQEAADEDDFAIEEIIVTATKRGAASVQDIPISLRAISGETLLDKGVEDYVDWARMVPGLIAQDQGPGEKRLIIRGVQSVGPATVGVYWDDSVITGSNLEDDGGGRNADIRLYDVERVEVLRGPQGTLYGAGSFSGTIRIITNKPDPSVVSTSVSTTLATTRKGDESYKANGHFNAPIMAGKLAVRGVAWYENEGGYIDNVRLGRDDINEEETYGGRFAVRLIASERLTIDASVTVQRTELDGKQRFFPAIGDLQTDEFTIDVYEDDLELYQLSLKYEADFGTFEASSGFLNRDVFFRFDSTPILLFFGVPVPFAIAVTDQPDKRDTWSNEIRFASNFDGPFQGIVGAFYQQTQKNFVSDVISASVDGVPNGTEADIFGRVSSFDSDQYALFGEFTYDVTDRFTVLAGFRYFDFNLDANSRETLPFGGFEPGNAPPPDPRRSASETSVSLKFSASYEINEEAMVYAVAAEGFREGGTNSTGFGNLFIIPEEFESDSIWNYELGAKTSWLDDRLIINVSGYIIEWSNIQTVEQEPVQGFQFIGNAGSARVKGFEFELFGRPAPGLDVTLSGGFQDARLTEDQPILAVETPIGRRGDRIPSVPQLSGAIAAQYTFPVGNGLESFVRGDLAYVSSSQTQFNDSGAFQNKQSDYTIMDLRFALEGEHWSAVAFVDNLFDQRADLTLVENRAVPLSVFTNRPRTFGITLTGSF